MDIETGTKPIDAILAITAREWQLPPRAATPARNLHLMRSSPERKSEDRYVHGPFGARISVQEPRYRAP